MKRSRTYSVVSMLLRKVRFVYEYPGHLVLADSARLKKTIKRALRRDARRLTERHTRINGDPAAIPRAARDRPTGVPRSSAS